MVEARSGEQGVSSRRERPPDLVLMDLQLPGIDGTEALRRLRAGPQPAGVPVVAVTAFAMREDRDRAFARRLRRLPREADQRARAARAGRATSSTADEPMTDELTPVTVLAVDDQPPEPPAARRGADARAATGC